MDSLCDMLISLIGLFVCDEAIGHSDSSVFKNLEQKARIRNSNCVGEK